MLILVGTNSKQKLHQSLGVMADDMSGSFKLTIPIHRHEFSLPLVQARIEITTSVLYLHWEAYDNQTVDEFRTSFEVRLTRLQNTSPGAHMLMILRSKSTR